MLVYLHIPAKLVYNQSICVMLFSDNIRIFAPSFKYIITC